MTKARIAQIIFLLAMIMGVLLLGLEIFAGHMEPDKIILFAVITGAGLLGTCACAFWRAFDQRKEK